MLPSYAAAGSGRVNTAEADLIVHPEIQRTAATRGPAINCIHSSGGSVSRSYMNNQADSPAQTAFVRALADRGRWPTIATDHGGSTTFGNATSCTRCNQNRTYMNTTTGFTSGPMIVFGSSQGTTGALNIARSNPAAVKAIVLALVVPDLEYLREQNPDGTVRGNIDTAAGVTYPALLPASYAFPDATIPFNPYSSTLSAPTTGLPVGINTPGVKAIPMRAYYVSNDMFTPQALTEEFVAAWGPNGSGVNVGALGHSDTMIGAIDLAELTAWLQAQGA